MKTRLITTGTTFRGFLLGAFAGGIVATAAMAIVAVKAEMQDRSPLDDREALSWISSRGGGATPHAIPADPAEGEDAAIFAGWC